MAGPRQLLVYEFGPNADFEGRVVGALERLESEPASCVLDGLFVALEAETGALQAIDLRSGSGPGSVARLLTFRLDPSTRQRATERALGQSGSVPAATVHELGSALEAGGAIVALLVERPEPGDLEDAVARSGGWTLDAREVEASGLAELASELATLVSSRRPS